MKENSPCGTSYRSFHPNAGFTARGRGFRPQVEALEERWCPIGGVMEWSDPWAAVRLVGGVAIQPWDGKIVGVGDISTGPYTTAIAVVRLNPDGSLDTTFNNGAGTLKLTVGVSASGEAVALQPDGKILVGGTAAVQKGIPPTDGEFVVARLNPDGSLDTTFGNTGHKGVGGGIWAYNPSAGLEAVHNLTVLTDSSNHVTGIMAGGTGNTAGHQSFAAVKLTAAGLPDTTFGVGSIALANAGGRDDNPLGMAVTPAGGVVLVGDAGNFGAVVAFTAAGKLDTTFNGTGSRLDQVNGTTTYFDAVTVQPTAGGGYGIVAVGATFPPGAGRSGLVVRYTSVGQLDPTFGASGIVITSNAAEFMAVGLEADGSIVVAGTAWFTNPNGDLRTQMAVGHLSAGGSWDTTFGTAGTGISVVPPLDPINGGDKALCLAIDADGSIVIGGMTGSGMVAFDRFSAP
jgi:uncharacterized delta-60 repeat protein